MAATVRQDRTNERGSAMIIAILVMVILTLLGISFLLMADTENRIAENEKLSAQALYFAEAGARRSQEVNFFKNIGVIAGLLFYFVSGAGRLSLSAWMVGKPTPQQPKNPETPQAPQTA